MPKRIFCLILVILCLFFSSGCALLKLAVSAGVAYGISEALD